MYRLILSGDGGTVDFPELPEELRVSSAVDAESETNLAGLERSTRQAVRLREYSFLAHLNVETGIVDAVVATLSGWMDKATPVRLIYATDRPGAGISSMVTVLSLECTEVGGDIGSVAVDVQLKDYRPPVIKELSFVQQAGEAVAVSANQREDTQPKPATYTMVAGDNLYNIAKAVYGDASRWPEIAKANNIQEDEYRRLQIGRELVLP